MNLLKENSCRVSGSDNPRQAETKAECRLKNNQTAEMNAGKQTGTPKQLWEILWTTHHTELRKWMWGAIIIHYGYIYINLETFENGVFILKCSPSILAFKCFLKVSHPHWNIKKHSICLTADV